MKSLCTRWGARKAQSVACLALTKLDTSAMQVRISLASLAKILISEKYPVVPAPAVVYINGLTVTFRVVLVSQDISCPRAILPHHVLEAELFKP